MAIPGAEACREPYRDLRGLARLRPQRDTSFYGQPLSVFQARHGRGIGCRDGHTRLSNLHAHWSRSRRTRLLPDGLGPSQARGASRGLGCDSDSRRVEPSRCALRSDLLALDFTGTGAAAPAHELRNEVVAELNLI